MKEILENIRIIPLEMTLRSEGTIHRQARKLANYIEHDGMQRDPIVVAPEGERYIALDGMHRVDALKVMGCRDLLAYIVDYGNHRILLESWDALIFDFQGVLDILRDEFDGGKYEIREVDCENGREGVVGRQSVIAVVDRNRKTFAIQRHEEKRKLTLDEVIRVLVKFERRLDKEGAKIRYVANTNSELQFTESESTFLVIRPRFTKTEVVERTLKGKLFPRKTTRHVIYERPLRVGVALSILKEDVDIQLKNRLLQAELQWRYENGRIRFYPEPIILFDE